MAKHSHWARIKHKKQITDIQKGRLFAKLTKEIEVAARQGKDLTFNSKLKAAIEKAKSAKMSSENIERAIKRGIGELSSQERLEEILFEAYGPGGIAILIEGITDNKNRALSEIKQTLNQNGGKLVSEGTIKWVFERKGCITVFNFQTKENLEIAVIEAGADDIYWHNNFLDIYTKIENLEKVKKNLEEKGIKIDSVSLSWVAKEEVSLDKKTQESCQKLFEALNELESVQEIYSNLKI